MVVGERRAKASSASEYRIELGKLHLVPRQNAAEQLMLAPGVLTVNHGGEGHANATFMRGFAAGHGEYIEFLIDGVPLNEVSNAHNHGYTDLHFMPPEFVRAVRVTEGPFDPEQGDFAFAGSAEYQLGMLERGARLSYGLGRFNSHRLLFSYAPAGADPATFAGFEVYRTDGFGPNRAAQRVTALGRYTDDEGPGGLRWAVGAYAYAGRWDQAGVLREDDYQLGDVGFFDTYDENQGGDSSRLLLTFDLAVGPQNRRFSQVAFFGLRDMRIRANFIGLVPEGELPTDGRGRPLDEWRGGAIELAYQALTAGTRGTYALSARIGGRKQTLTLGYAARYDRGSSVQLRLRERGDSVPYYRVFDREFSIVNLSGWLRAQLRPLSWLTVRGGLRADVFSFSVLDLNRFEVELEVGSRLGEQRSAAFGLAFNPRVTVDAKLVRGLHLSASYGQGTRSSEAAALSENETAPFAKAQVFDVGLHYHLGHKRLGKKGPLLTLDAQAAYSFAYVNRDIRFDEIAGRNQIFGSSNRHAVLAGLRGQLGRWLDMLFNLGWAYATWDEVIVPPSASPSDSRAGSGDLIEYIPQLIARLDVAVQGKLFGWRLAGVPVYGSAGLGFTYMPGRPLPLGAFGDDYYLFNVGGQVRLWHFTLALSIRNLFDQRYRQSEFNYPSDFRHLGGRGGRRNMRHFAAGEPFFAMATLTVHLEQIWQLVASSDPAKKQRKSNNNRSEL
jgi:iron complex outermembrane receptor protein